MNQFDVAIAGAGMVGATLACLLAKSGLKVAVIEQRESVAINPDRVVAVTPASLSILNQADIWQRIDPDLVSPYLKMQVWSSEGGGAVNFDSADVGAPTLGSLLANHVIETAAHKVLDALDNITWFRPAKVTNAEFHAGSVELSLDSGDSLSAVLLVGADGGHSAVREIAGIANQRSAYRQSALVCTVTTEAQHDQTARQRFLPDGPLAFLPLADPLQCSIVWTNSSAEAVRLAALDDDAFCAELTLAFEQRLGGVTDVGPRMVFELNRAHAEHYISERVALVGDAAHIIHPLAGQGVNLGLLDAASLADVIATARESEIDIGSRRVLRSYERWRHGENALMLTLMDTFNTVFCSDSSTVRRAGNLALSAADVAGPLKHLIMEYAMGRRGDVPSAARQVL